MDTQNNTPQPSNERKRQKRLADNSLVVCDDESDTSFPSFLVIEPCDNHAIKLSIFGLQKLLKCAVGEVKTAKKLRNGNILLEVANKQQAERALSLTSIVDRSLNPIPVKVTPHRSLNTSKGIIRSRDLRDCTDDEVLDALRPAGVTQVKHIMTQRSGISQATNTFILTFKTPTPPKVVRAAYLSLPVEAFIPNPLRCFNCQRFGHGRSTCNHKAICARCGKPDHADDSCTAEPVCTAEPANCAGPHPSYSKECPEWIKQRAVMQIKTERNISFSEAKQIYDTQSHAHAGTHSASLPRSGITYASACKSTSTMSTQTDYTWPLDSKVPVYLNTSAAFQHAETSTDETTVGAVGGKPITPTSSTSCITNIPHYSSTPKVKIQLHNSKPGPASSKLKPALGAKSTKGSNDPVKLYNRYGSLNAMDLEVNYSPKKGSSSRKNQ
jgi:hypothetical protein